MNVTELEMMERAKMYIDKLANGVNPLDDSTIPDGDVVNQVRLSRCFFFVSDVLRRVIENGGVETRAKAKTVPFELPYEKRARFEYSEKPIPITEIARRINALKPIESMKNLKYANITTWLLEIGMLKLEEIAEGKNGKRPTAVGNEAGITLEERTSSNGPYQVVVYDKKAQMFILDNLDAIIGMK